MADAVEQEVLQRISNNISLLLKHHGWTSEYEFSMAHGFHASTVNRLLKCQSANPNLETLRKVGAALGVAGELLPMIDFEGVPLNKLSYRAIQESTEERRDQSAESLLSDVHTLEKSLLKALKSARLHFPHSQKKDEMACKLAAYTLVGSSNSPLGSDAAQEAIVSLISADILK